MNRWVVVGAVSMAIAVALGAFGTHALRDTLTDKQLGWWATAQQYQVWHSLALLAVGIIGASRAVGWLFVVGIAVFAGTLYAMALGGPTWLGAVTPIGGASFIAGWLLLAVQSAKSRSNP
jgi:uncharacterized membrane protein YgdD (TMEM256/DUF423 family)